MLAKPARPLHHQSPTSVTKGKEVGECLAVLVIGCTLVGLLTSIGSHRSIAYNVAWVGVGVTAAATSFTAGIFGAMAVCRKVTGNAGESTGHLIVSALFAFLVAVPVGGHLVFRVMASVLPTW